LIEKWNNTHENKVVFYTYNPWVTCALVPLLKNVGAIH